MKISELASLETFTCVQGHYTDANIVTGFASDLLSDVMGNADENSVLITIQAHKNTVAVSSLAGVLAIIICSKRSCPEDMLESARDEGIAVFQTLENQFNVSALIAQQLG